jgi:hypothetical protein
MNVRGAPSESDAITLIYVIDSRQEAILLLKKRSPFVHIISMLTDVNAPVFVMIQHDMIEGNS